MKKSVKILSSLFVMLILLSNVNYAFTSSRCEMTKMSACMCESVNSGMNNAANLNFKAKSCCTTEIKIISNSSDFESNSGVHVNKVSEIISQNNPVVLPCNLLSRSNLKEILIFYPEPLDLTVMHSSLLI